MPLIQATWIYLLIIVTDAQFLTEPAASGTACIGIKYSYNFAWSYSVSPNIALSVVWQKDSSSILTWLPSSNNYIYGAGYSSTKVVHNNNNGDITIELLTPSDAGTYVCIVTYDVSGTIVTSNDAILVLSNCLISEMNTSVATEGMISVNSVFEFSIMSKSTSTITDSITPTSDSSVSTTSYLNHGTTIFYAHTKYSNFYSNIETATLYANIETTNLNVKTETANVYANTQSSEIQPQTSGIISKAMSTYQSMFVTTAVNYILGSFDTTIQIMTKTFVLPGYTISSYNEITVPSTFEPSDAFPQSGETLGDNFYTLHVSSGTLITTESSKYFIVSMTISSSYDGDSYIGPLSTLFSVPRLTTDTSDSASEVTSVSRVNSFSLTVKTKQTHITTATVDSSGNSKTSESSRPNSFIQQMIDSTLLSTVSVIDHISYSSKLNYPSLSSYQDNTHVPMDILTVGFLTFSKQDYAASASTSSAYIICSTDNRSSLHTSEYPTTVQTEYTSHITSSESHTDNSTTGIYSTELVTSANTYLQTSVNPSQTQLASMNDIQDLTTVFMSTYLEPYFQSTDEFFSSEISEYVLSTSLLLPLNTKENGTELDSYMKTTNMLTSKFQSSLLTLDFKTALLTTAINFNSESIPSMIKPSSKQTNSGISYIEIETAFKDSLFSLDSFSGSLTSSDHDMTSLSSGVSKSTSTMSTNIIQSGLSEKNKTIIFISTSSAVIAMIVVILLFIFAKVYKSKFNNIPPKEDDKTSWSNNSIPPKTAFPGYSFTGKNIYPLLNTSSSSLKMFHYEQHWNDVV